ncbi:MAG: transglutaminase-like domain-containing protein, partial [Phycisphaerales bacterium]|nr:transglutaminase-like domain-containing protein [Phycisphaerales bacterium]
MLTCDDPRVAELARDALTAAPEDAAKRAELLRRFVHRHIRTKDLSVGFASAAEVARTREGDCTEHGVLLAALLRADGIPSRVVSGLIYADQFAGSDDIFGYHMWTQAYLEIDGEPRWVDLDATLPDSLPMTATHIALAVTGLPDENRINALVELAPLMGRLAIKVENVE